MRRLVLNPKKTEEQRFLFFCPLTPSIAIADKPTCLGIANVLEPIYNREAMDNKKILIVEDEEAIQKAISEAFINQEFTTLTANDGEKGLAISLKEHPDIILLDILMPKMDGMIMLQKLRLDDWGKTVPVIILTNVNPNSSSLINSILQNEPAYYLVKSDVKLEGIVDKVKEVLKIED